MGATTRANGMAFSRACSAQFRSAGYLFSVLPASCRQNGTMRHATVCRQDAGSTFGVTFRPPLNTYGSPDPALRVVFLWRWAATALVTRQPGTRRGFPCHSAHKRSDWQRRDATRRPRARHPNWSGPADAPDSVPGISLAL